MHMGSRVDFAQLIKTYSSSQNETRYSPATITGIDKMVRFGNPEKLNYSRPIIETEATVKARNHYPTQAVQIITESTAAPATTTTQQGK
jgi:hypothetical protein